MRQYSGGHRQLNAAAGRDTGAASAPRSIRWLRFEVRGVERPSVASTLVIGEVAHLAAMAQYGRLSGGASSPALSGRDAAGRPLATGHQHVHFLPADEDTDGQIDHLTFWAPQGLNATEVASCLLIDALSPPHVGVSITEMPPMPLVCVGTGADIPGDLPRAQVGPARQWRSATPFVLTRHPKWKGAGSERRLVDGPEDQLRRELAHRGLAATLSSVAEEAPDESAPWRAFQTTRRLGQGDRPGFRHASGWRLTFAAAVTGPLVLGYGAHFGLGQFVAVDPNTLPPDSGQSASG